MFGDALRGYLALATGLTDVTRARATAAAKALVAQGEATRQQASMLAEDLLKTSRSNRDALVALVRYEIDRALKRAGLATAESVTQLEERLRELEKQSRQRPSPTPRKTTTRKAGS
jgi:polyhydroxyalkanoate synthesis regulator phasin